MKTARGPYCGDFQIIRVTNEEDGKILPRNYAYWQAINAHRNLDELHVLAGTDRGPCLWRVNKTTDEVHPLGPIFAGTALQNSTAEGWYFSAFDPFLLYCSDDNGLYRYWIDSGKRETVAATEQGLALRQWHSSFDENVHSATVLQRAASGSWPKLGTLVIEEGKARRPFPAHGTLDESQIDKSGRYLAIKENNDHRIIDLVTGEERVLSDQDGALGHSDTGFRYAVGADNWQSLAAWRLHDFTTGESRIIYETPWDAQISHVSHCQARLAPADSQWVLGSGSVPFLMRIYLDGVTAAQQIAPTMCVGTGYDNLPKASLDPYGEYAYWLRSNGTRHDAFIVRVP